MKVTAKFKQANGTVRTQVLADHGVSSPKNFRIDGEILVEEIQLFRAVERKFQNRGNQKIEITFESAMIDLAGPAEITMFQIAQPQQVLGQGDVDFEIKWDFYNSTYKWTVKDAIVHSFGLTYIGVSLFRFFRITGSAATPGGLVTPP